MQPPKGAGVFLGVRLDHETTHRLDRIVRSRGLPNRSEAVRQLLREADPEATVPRSGSLPTTGAEGGPDLPASLAAELEELVEDGWANSVADALSKAVERGLTELALDHGERRRASRDASRELHERRMARRRAASRGDGLLGK